MNSSQKKYFKENIASEINKLEGKISELKDLTKPIALENPIGRISRMDAINNKSVNEAALRTAEGKLSKLQLALQKVDNKDFGLCIRCGQEIPEGRLMIMPESVKCVRCAG